MDSSDRPEKLPPAPTYSPRPLFRHHHHLKLSPHCPQHGAYFFGPNSHLHHHHHHLELSPDCPLHGHLLPHCPLHTSNNQSTTTFPIIPNFSSTPQLSNPNFNSIPPEADASANSEALMMQDGNEEEDEEEFIFVLTDEWKEFFAKSEAKRRLAKKQAKKKGND